ncbi:MAG: hypothetical protein AAFZ52_02890 [Bacteroidota bacterium]
MQQFLVMAFVVLVAVGIYWPILRKARVDINARAAAGISNGPLYAVLLLPLIGPLMYLAFRSHFKVE